MLNSKESILSYMMKLSAIIITLVFLHKVESFYVAVSLMYGINALVRLRFLKNQAYALSLVFEIAIVSYMFMNYGGILHMLYYSILLDIIDLEGSAIYLVGILSLSSMAYFIRGEGALNVILLTTLFAVMFIFIIKMKGMDRKLDEVEYLYDDIRRYSYELESTRNMLLEYSKKVEHTAQLEERDRISREIHDTIGHNLTGLYMQSELCLKAMGKNREEGMEILGSIRDNLRESIDVMRSTVRRMKPKHFEGRSSYIRDMAEKFGQNTGISVTYNEEGVPFEISPNTAVILYKNTQEAITNSVRHGKAKNIKVTLRYAHEGIVLEVEDDGAGCEKMNKGMGISGMEERARLFGGRVEIEPCNGFKIVTRIPITEGRQIV